MPPSPSSNGGMKARSVRMPTDSRAEDNNRKMKYNIIKFQTSYTSALWNTFSQDRSSITDTKFRVRKKNASSNLKHHVIYLFNGPVVLHCSTTGLVFEFASSMDHCCLGFFSLCIFFHKNGGHNVLVSPMCLG